MSSLKLFVSYYYTFSTKLYIATNEERNATKKKFQNLNARRMAIHRGRTRHRHKQNLCMLTGVCWWWCL